MSKDKIKLTIIGTNLDYIRYIYINDHPVIGGGTYVLENLKYQDFEFTFDELKKALQGFAHISKLQTEPTEQGDE